MPETGNKLYLNSQIYGNTPSGLMPGVLDLYIFLTEYSVQAATAQASERRFLDFEFWETGNSISISELESVFTSSKLLNQSNSYRRVICSINYDSGSIFIPDALYDSNSAKQQYEIAFGNMSHKALFLTDTIPQHELKNIFTISSDLAFSFSKQFHQTEFHHPSTARLAYLSSVAAPLKAPIILADIDKTIFSLTILKGKSFQFYNTYNYNSAEELLYYLLLVFEQLQLNPEESDLFLTGLISDKSEIFSLACRYIQNCRIADLPTLYNYEKDFSFLNSAFHFNIFCLPTCVS